MPDAVTIIRERQLAVRREMDRRGVSLKAVALDSGVPYDTIKSYFPGEQNKLPAAISGAAIFALCEGKALSLDLVSLLLPVGFQVVRAPEDLDHDALCEMAADYVAEKNRAHHPESEAGRDIGPKERRSLDGKVVQLRAAA